MKVCELKKGDRLYECKYHQAVLTELMTNPIAETQGDGSRFWRWKARVVGTDETVDYGISEKDYHYGPYLYRQNMYEVGEDKAERVLPPFVSSFQDYVEALVAKVAQRTADEIPESGDFFPVLEVFRNPDKSTQRYVGTYGLQVFKMRYDVESDPIKRFVEAAAFEPSGEYKSSFLVASGTKEEVLATLRSEDFIQGLLRSYGQLADALRDL